MSQRLVTLRQMQTGVGVITAISLGIVVPGVPICAQGGGAPDVEKMEKQATLILDQVDNVRQIFIR